MTILAESMSATLEPKHKGVGLGMSVFSDAVSSVQPVLNLAAGVEKNDKNSYFMLSKENFTPHSFTIKENPAKPTPNKNPIKIFFDQGEIVQGSLRCERSVSAEALRAWKKFTSVVNSYVSLGSISLTQGQEQKRRIEVDKEFFRKVEKLLVEEPKGVGAVIGELRGYHNKGEEGKSEIYILNQSSGQEVRVDLTAEQVKQYSSFFGDCGKLFRIFGTKKYNFRKQLVSLELMSMEKMAFRKKFDYEKGRALFGYRPADVTMGDLVQTIKESRA